MPPGDRLRRFTQLLANQGNRCCQLHRATELTGIIRKTAPQNWPKPPPPSGRGTAWCASKCSPPARHMAFVNTVQKPQEQVSIVDKHNKVVGGATRKQMREQNLMHRASFVLIFNKQVRSARTDIEMRAVTSHDSDPQRAVWPPCRANSLCRSGSPSKKHFPASMIQRLAAS